MLAGQALVKYLLLREQTLLRRTHSSGRVKDVFFLFPSCQEYKGPYSLWSSRKALLGKTKKTIGIPWTDSTWSFHISEIAILSLQEFINYSSGSLTLTLVLVQRFLRVRCDSPCSFVGCSNSGAAVCFVNSLKQLRRIAEVCSVFTSC